MDMRRLMSRLERATASGSTIRILASQRPGKQSGRDRRSKPPQLWLKVWGRTPSVPTQPEACSLPPSWVEHTSGEFFTKMNPLGCPRAWMPREDLCSSGNIWKYLSEEGADMSYHTTVILRRVQSFPKKTNSCVQKRKRRHSLLCGSDVVRGCVSLLHGESHVNWTWGVPRCL